MLHPHTAWHGTKIEALFRILASGGLQASRVENGGEVKADTSAVYCMTVGCPLLARKAEGYMRFIDVCGDGVLWAVKLELCVDRDQKLDRSHMKTDQWMQAAASVQPLAVWLCGRLPEEMAAGDWWCPQGWRPDLEANPLVDWLPGDEVLLPRTRAMEDVWATPSKRPRTDTRKNTS